jgi:putative PIN family toxin of toxin-antitoxin system
LLILIYGFHFLYKNISVIASPKIVEEFLDVSSREKLKKYIKRENIPKVLDLIKTHCVNDPVEYATATELRDPDDLYLLALSDIVGANFLLTGDKDLLALEKYNKTEIISYSEFIANYKSFFARIKRFFKKFYCATLTQRAQSWRQRTLNRRYLPMSS